ncbi:MAG: DUF169 domain-containing protein [Deltaproteobacteria bacterium]|nr:DUF169 domain-containing protein [Deltaproteobacteria bacterium]
MSDSKEQARALNKYIRPLTFPIGVKLMKNRGDFPEKTRFPRDMGFKATPCVGIALARKYGWTVGITPGDNPCPVASYLYGWSSAEEESREILSDFMKAMRYTATDEAVDTVVEEATKFKLARGQCEGVVISPLELGRVEPDLVMIFCNSAQVMRLVHGATRQTGRSLSSIFSGRFGACNEGVLQTLKAGEPRLVLPGNGDRVWGMVQDEEWIFTIPAGRLDQVIEGLQATHEAGVRYPIPVDVRRDPRFPPQLRMPKA